jgi:replicative DNA helicase
MSEPQYTVTNLADHATEDSGTPPVTLDHVTVVQDLLENPYSIDRWRVDLREMQQGSPTCFDVLDELGMRWLPGKLTAVIARPGHGKTAFMLESCARYLEKNPDKHAVFLSWEEPLVDVVTRLIQRADARLIRHRDSFEGPPLYPETVRATGRGTVREGTPFTERIETASFAVEGLLQRLHLIDGDQLGRDVRIVLREVGAWMRSNGAPSIGLVAMDYFQKLRGSKDSYSRQAELQDVADAIRRFAKGSPLIGDSDQPTHQFAVPVIVGAQVNRTSVSSEGPGHPSGDDIREADDLLNDAASIISLSWEEATDTGISDPVRSLRIAVPKHRGGRARGIGGREYARITWHPARQYIADQAIKDANGAIRWSGSHDETVRSTKSPRVIT